ncbi:uncharacterized protein LOC123917559 isoform X2 [Trifolium pratense]|uniref:uncharacterized protein LOC123917559 isoform X2 n=1 Tax=Trifolium pratense TaxID=57577 RepID=UPI001E6970A5|nr:uncharacterized protein LOC123917559 isoform X2 [Trifolium pratense]
MFNELTTGSYRIPWLIWIQLIVLILLFALFYFFTIVFDDDAATVSALPETSSASTKGFLFEEIQQIDNDSIAPVSTNRQHQITLEKKPIKLLIKLWMPQQVNQRNEDNIFNNDMESWIDNTKQQQRRWKIMERGVCCR